MDSKHSAQLETLCTAGSMLGSLDSGGLGSTFQSGWNFTLAKASSILEVSRREWHWFSVNGFFSMPISGWGWISPWGGGSRRHTGPPTNAAAIRSTWAGWERESCRPFMTMCPPCTETLLVFVVLPVYYMFYEVNALLCLPYLCLPSLFAVSFCLDTGSPSVAQTKLHLEVFLPWIPLCWITGMYLHGQRLVFVTDNNLVDFCSYLWISLNSYFVLSYAYECLSACMYVQSAQA